MTIRTGILALVVAASGFVGPLSAQVAGGWATQGDSVRLSADDGSQTIIFQCDPVAGAMLVSVTLDSAAVQPGRITVRADNGTAYSVPLRLDAGALKGRVSMSLVNQGGFAPATTLIVTSPPSSRQAIVIDVSQEFTSLVGNCPTL